MKSKEIKHLPRNYTGKELDPKQGVLDLQIDRQAEIEGVGMGVLRDRRWLQDEYLDGGKFKNYLKGKKEIPPSVSQLAIERLSPTLIER